MRTKFILPFMLLFFIIAVLTVPAQSASSLEELTRVMDSARVVETDIFAPEAFSKAEKRYAQAKEAVDRGKNQKTIDSYAGEAREFVENALKATEVCKLTIKDYLPPRDKAREAKAPVLVPEIYEKAELQFMIATHNVEKGHFLTRIA